MELLYIWVESFNNIKRQGFSFANDYSIDFIPDGYSLDDYGIEYISRGELKLIKNTESRIKNFFNDKGKIINVTAIVGENGSGKTSLLRLLMEWSGNANIKQIIVYKDKEEIKVAHHSKINIYPSNTFQLFPYQGNTGINMPELDIFKIYNSNTLNKLVVRKTLDYDVSTGYLLHKKDSDKKTKILREFWFEEIDRIITFLNNDVSKKISFVNNTGINWIHIFPDFQHFDVYNILQFFSTSVFFNSKNIFNKNFDTDKKKSKERLVTTFCFSFLAYYIKEKEDDNSVLKGLSKFKEFNETKDLLKQLELKRLEDILNIEFVVTLIDKGKYEYLFDSIKVFEFDNTIDKEKILNFLNTVKITHSLLKVKNHKQFYSELKKLFSDEFYSFFNMLDWLTNLDDKYIKYNTIDEHIIGFEFRLSLKKAKEFLSIYEKTLDKNPFPIEKYLNIGWSLSAGEMAMLNNTARLYSVAKKTNKDKSAYLLLLDEIELYLHPQWMKKFFNILINILPSIFDKPIQIILTSHSPFILSDLPSENIIFLKKGIKTGNCEVIKPKKLQRTFGDNIHTLLSNAFFLQDGLIGDFAKNKILKIIRFSKLVENWDIISDYSKHRLERYFNKWSEEFWYTQRIIGEEYIRNRIKNHLTEIEKTLLGIDKKNQNEIKRLIEEYGEENVRNMLK